MSSLHVGFLCYSSDNKGVVRPNQHYHTLRSSRLHNLVTSRQQDKASLAQMERKLQEERKARATTEQQLSTERKCKRAEEAAAARAVALATSR